jgi:hypothetical protein
LNTLPRALNGEPLTEEDLSQRQTAAESVVEEAHAASKTLDMPYPEDEGSPAEEKKDDMNPKYTAARVTNVEVSFSDDEETPADKSSLDYALERGDVVLTGYGRGKVLSTMKETGSLEVELPYGRLFVRLTESVRKEKSAGDDDKPEKSTSQAEAAKPKEAGPSECHSGIWLFTDRENISHFFEPNFFPPYNTPEKKKIILDVLREEWDEKTLSWKPCGQGSMTKAKPEPSLLGDIAPLSQLDELMGHVLSTINGCCTPQATAPHPKTM